MNTTPPADPATLLEQFAEILRLLEEGQQRQFRPHVEHAISAVESARRDFLKRRSSPTK